MSSAAAFLDAMLARLWPEPPDLAILAPHQRAAVARLRGILDRHGGAVLADDVGLGKSYVAAAVAKAAVAAGEEVELIVPAALVAQWTNLQKRFGLDLPVRSHDALLRADLLPRPGGLIIVDEAHRFRNPATKRYRSLALRVIGKKLLLVTATPVCNGAHDLAALLRLIVPDDAVRLRGVESIGRAFAEERFDQLAVIVEELVVRRDRRALTPRLQFGSMRREIVKFPASTEVVRSELDALRFPLIAAAGDVPLLRGLLQRRLESSRAALLDSLRRQRRFYCRAREALREGRNLSKRDYRKIFGDDDDGAWFQDVLFRDLWLPPASGNAAAIESVVNEIAALDRCLAAASEVADSKLDVLRGLLATCARPLLVYTSAIATARDLHRNLGREVRSGLVTSKDAMSGALRASTPEAVFSALRELDVLVTTDLGAEGLNLQEAAAVVHYDLPWNPVRIDQRNGRAHRIGQRRDVVSAIYFVPDRRSDRAILRAITSKNRVRRSLLDEDPEFERSEAVDAAILARAAPPEGMALVVESSDDFVACVVSIGRRRMLLAVAGGFIIDSEAQIVAAIRRLRGRGDVVPLRDAAMDDAQLKIERTFRSRLLIPPSIGAASPQALFFDRAWSSRQSESMSDVLRRPMRAGASFLLTDVAREYLDADRIEQLRTLLCADHVPEVPRDCSVTIEAAIVARPGGPVTIAEQPRPARQRSREPACSFYLAGWNSALPFASTNEAYA